jgi:ABC-type glycerol-3-phosphate transport system permease component
MHRKRTGVRLLHLAGLGLLLLLTLAPFYFTLSNSFKYYLEIVRNFWGFQWPPHGDNYADALVQLLPYFRNSFIVTFGVVAGVLIVATTASYSFARFRYPGKEVLYFLVIMLFMVPGFLLLVPQFVLIKHLGMLNTYQGQIFPPLALGSTMATMLIREFFQGIPKGFFEAAEIEGAREWKIFLHIAVPLSYPIISVVAILNAMHAWNNYIWPLVITSGESVKPIILVLGHLSGSLQQGLGLQLAGYVLASIPLIVLFSFATRTFVSGLTTGSMKG